MAPKTLSKKAGFAARDPADGQLLCSSAGTHNILRPNISGKLKARSVRNIDATKPDLIATGTAIPTPHTLRTHRLRI